jgi:hypothetical protein
MLNVRRALAGHPGIREVTITGEGDLVEVIYAPARECAACWLVPPRPGEPTIALVD